jgi:hypothetical protein
MFSWAGTESKAEIRPINFRTNIFDGKEPWQLRVYVAYK